MCRIQIAQTVIVVFIVIGVTATSVDGHDLRAEEAKSEQFFQQPGSTGRSRTVVNHPSSKTAKHCPVIRDLETKCRLPKDCAVWYDLISKVPDAHCKLQDDGPGICCPDLPENDEDEPLRPVEPDRRLNRNIDVYSINAAAHAAKFLVKLTEETEKLMRDNNVTVRLRSAHHSHLLFHLSKPPTQIAGRSALEAVKTAQELVKRFQIPVEEASGLSQYNLKDTILNSTCPVEPVCSKRTAHSPYRTINGTCNNLIHPSWGAAGTSDQRILPPDYADGIWAPRKAANGGDLPGPRVVSLAVAPDIDAPSPTETLWVMRFGQFVVHDTVSTPVFRMANGAGIECCAADEKELENTALHHPECLPISIPADDPFYSKFGLRCMSFVRSIPAPREDCKLGYAEQMNQATHFLDASTVYGVDLEDSNSIRTFRGGKLTMRRLRGKHELPLLPPNDDPGQNCSSKNDSLIKPPVEVKCFKAGDQRVNQEPDLAVIHTLFARHHNLLADQLAQLNPSWSDRRLFNEARRILIAQVQHITYNEWLPIIIGRKNMKKKGLLPLAHGFSRSYDENVNPSMITEFATAANRFGHSLIQGQLELVNKKRQVEYTLLLRNHFFKTGTLYKPGNIDKFLIGLASEPMQQFDNWFTQEVTNHVYQEEGKGFGKDLVSLNTNRGRDHGLRGYNSFRPLYGLTRATSFDDLLDVIPEPVVEIFKTIYENVDDIDLFIGGVSEQPIPGAVVGPTFAGLIAEQFQRLKKGDRYFYDLGGQAGSFTEDQLHEIRQTSFSRIICDNSQVEKLQPSAFKAVSALNPIVKCDSSAIPQVSLHPWKEEAKD